MAFASVNIYHAKTHLSSLLQMVERGDDVVIARAGKPIARLVKFAATRPKRKLGQWEGQIWVAADFDEECSGIADMFEGV